MLRPTPVVLVLALFAPRLATQEVKWWLGTFDAALEAAKDTKAGAVLLYFWRDNHDGCKVMFGETLADKAAQQAISGYVCMGAKKEEPAGEALFKRFGIEQLPTILFVRPDGTVDDVLPGFMAVKPFLAEIERVLAGKETIAAMRKAVAEKPDDLALQLRLAKKLRGIGDRASAEQVIDTILGKDPKGASEAAAEAQLLRIQATTFRPEVTPKDTDLKALKEFLVKQKNKRILFLGYDRIAAAELARDNIKAAAEAAEKAWRNIPPELVLEWGQNIAAKAYGYWKELDKNQLKLALEISAKALKAAEALQKERGDPFLANSLYLHASVQIVNNLRKEAFATMDRAIQLDPKNDNLKNALKAWQDGSK